MPVELIWEYRRDDAASFTPRSTGCITSKDNGLVTEEGSFTNFDFRKMTAMVSDVMKRWPDEVDIDVILKRTDREGLTPCKLDVATSHLIRTDPIAAIAALSVPDRSPSEAVRKVVENRVPIVTPPLPVGDAVLANAFGDQLYFKVRGHELECPGCGFWGAYTTAGLLNDTDRAGDSFKTAFVCTKRCGCARFLVTCNKEWGYVDTTYLLGQTKLAAFYFPRAWNGGRPWVTRDRLQQLFDQYKEEKEKAS